MASWRDWNLLSMHEFERHIPGNRRQLFRDLTTTMSRALAQLNDFIFTAWGNLELKRRDVAFQHLHASSAKELLHPLRAAPLFGAALVPNEIVTGYREEEYDGQRRFHVSLSGAPKKEISAV